MIAQAELTQIETFETFLETMAFYEAEVHTSQILGQFMIDFVL